MLKNIVNQTQLNTLCEYIGVTRLSNVTDLDSTGVFVVNAIRPTAKCLTVSQGKGITLKSAIISAVMESLELYFLENIARPNVSGSYDQLKHKISLVNPKDLNHGFLISDELEKEDFEWLRTTDIVTGTDIYIPYDSISMDTTSLKITEPYFKVTTNGMGAHFTSDAAKQHALLELIERDVIAMYLDNASDIDVYRIDIESLSIKAIQKIIRSSGLRVYCVLINNPYGLPVVKSFVDDSHCSRQVGVTVGSACAFDINSALLKAVIEAMQHRLTIIAGARDDNFPGFYDHRFYNKIDHTIVELPTYHPNFTKALDKQPCLRNVIDSIVTYTGDRLLILEDETGDFGVNVVKIISTKMRDGH